MRRRSVTSYPGRDAVAGGRHPVAGRQTRTNDSVEREVVQHARAGPARAPRRSLASGRLRRRSPARAPAERGRVIRYGGVEVIEVDRGLRRQKGGAQALPAGEACGRERRSVGRPGGASGIGSARAAGIVEGRPCRGARACRRHWPRDPRAPAAPPVPVGALRRPRRAARFVLVGVRGLGYGLRPKRGRPQATHG